MSIEPESTSLPLMKLHGMQQPILVITALFLIENATTAISND